MASNIWSAITLSITSNTRIRRSEVLRCSSSLIFPSLKERCLPPSFPHQILRNEEACRQYPRQKIGNQDMKIANLIVLLSQERKLKA